MAPVVSWVWREEEQGGGVGGLEAPIRVVREVGGVWEEFHDEVVDK